MGRIITIPTILLAMLLALPLAAQLVFNQEKGRFRYVGGRKECLPYGIPACLRPFSATT